MSEILYSDKNLTIEKTVDRTMATITYEINPTGGFSVSSMVMFNPVRLYSGISHMAYQLYKLGILKSKDDIVANILTFPNKEELKEPARSTALEKIVKDLKNRTVKASYLFADKGDKDYFQSKGFSILGDRGCEDGGWDFYQLLDNE